MRSSRIFEAALRAEAGFLLAGSGPYRQGRLSRHPQAIEPGLTVLARELLVGMGDVDLSAQDTLWRSVEMVECGAITAALPFTGQVDFSHDTWVVIEE